MMEFNTRYSLPAAAMVLIGADVEGEGLVDGTNWLTVVRLALNADVLARRSLQVVLVAVTLDRPLEIHISPISDRSGSRRTRWLSPPW
jgi:hypothetical protein